MKKSRVPPIESTADTSPVIQPHVSYEDVDLPCDSIDEADQLIRQQIDDDYVTELSMSILRLGLLEPIVVEPTHNGRFRLLAGLHRLTAFRKLRKATIPCRVCRNPGAPVKAIALVENITRRDLSLAEEVQAVSYLFTEEKMSVSQICDLTGKSRAWADVRLAIPNMPDDVKEELLAGSIRLGHAEVLALITDRSLRALMLNQVISSKLTAKQTSELAEMYMACPSIQSAVEAGLQTQEEIQTPQQLYRKCALCGQAYLLSSIIFHPVCITCNQSL